jgi:hypothetical protein
MSPDAAGMRYRDAAAIVADTERKEVAVADNGTRGAVVGSEFG